MMCRKHKCRVSMDSGSGQRRDVYKDVDGRKRQERVFEQVVEDSTNLMGSDLGNCKLPEG